MGRWAYRARAVLAALGCAAAGCGAASPNEADIYHDPALRPGVVAAAAQPETELLARLSQREQAPRGRTITVDDRRFELDPPYHAASGRWCRAVRSDDRTARLACETDDGWVFVPRVVPSTALEPAP